MGSMPPGPPHGACQRCMLCPSSWAMTDADGTEKLDRPGTKATPAAPVTTPDIIPR